MKKRNFAGLLLLAPVMIFSGCTSGNTTPVLNANWYRNTTVGASITGTSEKLTYSVVHEKPKETSRFFVEYDEGVYTTELSDTTYENAKCYRYQTELRISGRIVLGEESVEFNDFVTSDTWFMSVAESLRPLYSVKTVHSTSPLASPANPPASLTKDVAYGVFEYQTTTTYDAALTEARIKTDDLTTTEDDDAEPVLVRLSGSGVFFDNDEILFALRALDFTSNVSFRTIDPVTRTQETMRSPVAPVDIDPAPEYLGQTVEAVRFRLLYAKQNSGEARTLVYAKKTSDRNNTFRNALLRMDSPVVWSHGTLVYSLANAEFTQN